MRWSRASLPIALAIALSSCSGVMDIHACLLNGQLAFELGDVTSFVFFKVRPAPHHMSVQIPGDAAWKDQDAWQRRQMWNAESYAHAKPEPKKRSVIRYGQELEGFTVLQAPRRLKRGVTYRAWVNAGAYVGSTDFIYSSRLPACSKKE